MTDWQETLNDIARLEADNAGLRATIDQLGENAATAAREYAEKVAALRVRVGNLEGMLGQALPYVTKCADMDLADAVACMMLIEHELRNATLTERKP